MKIEDILKTLEQEKAEYEKIGNTVPLKILEDVANEKNLDKQSQKFQIC